jgi:hypothetical protein
LHLYNGNNLGLFERLYFKNKTRKQFLRCYRVVMA